MIKSLRITTLFVLLLSAVPAHAASYIAEETLFLESPISGDAYAAGGKVSVSSTISGDLFVAGGDVTVTGEVVQDLMVGGGQVKIRGDIGDDVRVGGGEVQITSSVDGDIIVFAGNVEVADGAIVGGDLVVNGGQVTMNGTVNGNTITNAGVLFMGGTSNADFTFNGDELYMNGTINGNSRVVAKKMTLSDRSRFRGDVEYWTKEEPDFGSSVLGTINYNEELKPYSDKHMQKAKAGAAAGLAALAAGTIIYTILSALLFIVLVLALTKTYFPDAAKRLQKEPWLHFVYGVLFFIATPVVGILFCITIIGIPIGAAIFAVYAFTIAFAKLFTAVTLGKYWEARSPKKKYALWQSVGIAMLMYIALKVIGIVPVLGWIVVFVATCMAIGALIMTEYQKYLKVR